MARLDRLFSLLIETLGADRGYVELPGQPQPPDRPGAADWPNVPGAGWLTYLAGAGVSAPPPAVVTPFASGVKVVASPGAVPDDYREVAGLIEGVRGAIAGRRA